MGRVGKCPQGSEHCVYSFSSLNLPLSAFYSAFTFQVFVNFARLQHGEDDSQAYVNAVDTSDELPMESLKTSQEAQEV